MALTLTVEVFGERVVARRLLRFQQAAVDLSPALERVADRLRVAAELQFATEGGWGSGGWAALAPSTVAAKQRRGLDPRVLQATGALRRSLVERGGAHVEEVDRDTLRFGSSVPYGPYHQRGTSRMPRRRPVELPEHERRAVATELLRHLAGAAA